MAPSSMGISYVRPVGLSVTVGLSRRSRPPSPATPAFSWVSLTGSLLLPGERPMFAGCERRSGGDDGGRRRPEDEDDADQDHRRAPRLDGREIRARDAE